MPKYCEDCPVPTIRAYLAELRAAQALDKALFMKIPAKDSASALTLQAIMDTRAQLIEIKQGDFEIAHPGCKNCTAYPHTE